MNLKTNIIGFYFTIILLILLGIYVINYGNIGLGIGIIVGALGILVFKSIQRWKITQLAKKSIVTYDERSLHLSAKAALVAIRIYIFLLSISVLIGSIFNPDFPFTSWDLMGILLSLLILLWIGFYYYYNKVE